MKVWVFSFCAILFSINAGAAATKRVATSIDHQTQSVRALGMGGAFAAVADDYNALAFNPAGLAFLKEWQMHMTIGASIDSDVLSLMNDISDATDQPGATEEEETDAIIEAIENQFGKDPHLRLTPLYGAWVWPGMGFSFTPADVTLDIGVDQQVGPSLEIATTVDTTFMIGYAREIKSRKAKLAWGVTAKAVHRGFYQDTVSAAQLAEDDEFFRAEDADEGLTFDADVGVLYTPNPPGQGPLRFIKYIQPTFALVARNVVDYGFTTNLNLIDENSGEPPKLGRRFDFGSKFELPKLWVFHPRFAFDLRDMGHDQWSFKKGYHAGFELEWVVGNWLRGAYRVGLNQGYLTYGVTAKLAWFQLDAASWGEETGVSEKSNQSRRYMVNLSLDF